jgi:hypothetical protein
MLQCMFRDVIFNVIGQNSFLTHPSGTAVLDRGDIFNSTQYNSSFAGSTAAAANILNKQSRTVDKGWSSSLGLGLGLTTSRRKK